jgi:purine-cytosine permease-like protein
MRKISWITVFTLLAIATSAVRIVYLFLIDLFKFPEYFLDYIDYTIVGLMILILIFWFEYRQSQAKQQKRLQSDMLEKRRKDFQSAVKDQEKEGAETGS